MKIPERAGFAVVNAPSLSGTEPGTSEELCDVIFASVASTLEHSDDLDFVLINGSLTQRGERLSHAALALRLHGLEASGVPVYVTSGWADIAGGDAGDPVSSAEFERIYADFGYAEAISRDSSSLSYVAEPVPGVWLFVLDTCCWSDHADQPTLSGAISPATLAWAVAHLGEARRRGKQVIGMAHHGLVEHFSGQGDLFPGALIADWRAVSETLAENGLGVVFTGHNGTHDITARQFLSGAQIYDVETGALSAFPLPFRLADLDLQAETLTIRSDAVTDIPGGDDFAGYWQHLLDDSLHAFAFSRLTDDPESGGYGFDPETAREMAPLLADALKAHRLGREVPDATAEVAVEGMKLSGNPVRERFARALESYRRDLPPSDRSVRLHLTGGRHDYAGLVDGFTMGIGHLNDSHANLEESTLSLVFDGTKTYAPVGGYARLVQKSATLRASHENFLLLNAGDVFTGTLFFTRYKGRADLDLLEMMQVDAMVPGNHEFDRGTGGLADFIDHASFPLVAANLDASADDRLAGKIAPYTIKNLNGLPVGILGLACEETPNISSPGETVVFGETIAAARAAVDELKARGIRVIIALTHQGVEADRKLAQSVNDIDVIVGGHSHTLLGDYADVSLHASGLPYPLIEHSPDGNKVLIVHAWANARALGDLTLMFDADGRVSRYGGASRVLLGRPVLQKNGTGEKVPVDALTFDTISACVAAVPGLEFVPEEVSAAACIAELNQPIEAMKNEAVARVSETLWHTRVPGSVHDQAGVQPRGSLIAPHVAEAMLQKAHQANMADVRIAIQHAGGVRTDLLKGDCTVGDAFTLLPFGNTLVTLSLTGDQLQCMLSGAVLRAASGTFTGAFPYTAGLRYDFVFHGGVDPKMGKIEVFDGEGWAALIPELSYRIVTNAYLAKGGDGYPDFSKTAGFYDTGFVDVDVFMAYAKELETLEIPRMFAVGYMP